MTLLTRNLYFLKYKLRLLEAAAEGELVEKKESWRDSPVARIGGRFASSKDKSAKESSPTASKEALAQLDKGVSDSKKQIAATTAFMSKVPDNIAPEAGRKALRDPGAKAMLEMASATPEGKKLADTVKEDLPKGILGRIKKGMATFAAEAATIIEDISTVAKGESTGDANEDFLATMGLVGVGNIIAMAISTPINAGMIGGAVLLAGMSFAAAPYIAGFLGIIGAWGLLQTGIMAAQTVKLFADIKNAAKQLESFNKKVQKKLEAAAKDKDKAKDTSEEVEPTT